MKPGNIVVNAKGWQGRVEQIKKSKQFGTQVLVQYATRREWENLLCLHVVVRKDE